MIWGNNCKSMVPLLFNKVIVPFSKIWTTCILIACYNYMQSAGADPGFQVKGGALKKISPSGGRCEKFWGISCEKSRFYDKKIIFFPIAEGGAKIFGVFRVKNHDFTPKKIIFFPILGGGGAPGASPPLDPPLISAYHH